MLGCNFFSFPVMKTASCDDAVFNLRTCGSFLIDPNKSSLNFNFWKFKDTDYYRTKVTKPKPDHVYSCRAETQNKHVLGHLYY